MSSLAGLDKWHARVETMDSAVLPDLIAEDGVFHSPVVHSPQKGRDMVIAYLSAADLVLGNDSFRYVREIVDVERNEAVLEFELEIDGIHINGVDIITWNDDDLIQDFKVMIRPMQAMNKVWEEMGKMLEKMKG